MRSLLEVDMRNTVCSSVMIFHQTELEIGKGGFDEALRSVKITLWLDVDSRYDFARVHIFRNSIQTELVEVDSTTR